MISKVAAEWTCLPYDPYSGEILTVEAKRVSNNAATVTSDTASGDWPRTTIRVTGLDKGKKYRFSVIGTTESGCQHGSADSNTISKWWAPPCVSERPFMSEVEWVDRSQT